MDMQTLLKSRSMNFSKITGALAKSTEGGYDKDDSEYWKLTKDKAGNASAVIRILPAAEGDDLPWVQIYNHAFKGPGGKWYIENCLSTIGQPDPVNEANQVLWQGGDKEKAVARERKRKLTYIGQVYIVSDPGNRENEGKVFKYKFGKKIFEKIVEKLEPTFEDDKPLNVFDLWEGANFKLRMRQVEGYANYDQSTFGDVGPVAETDEEILAIVKQQKSLRDLVDPSKFKSYDELKKKMESVLSNGAVQRASVMEDVPAAEAKVSKVLEAKAPKTSKVTEPVADEMEDYFASIAGGSED